MSFYICQLVEPLIILNASTCLLVISYQSSTISYSQFYQIETRMIWNSNH